jgi:uncharacterized delta-60 repeat protein
MLMTTRYLAIVALIAASALVATSTALAAPSTLDSSYGVGGIATSGIPTDTNDSGPFGGFAFKPDGSAFVGSNQPGATGADNDYFTVTGLTPNGTIDPSFAEGGTWTDFFGSTNSRLRAISTTPNGTVFAAGYSGSYLAAAYRSGAAETFFVNPNGCEAVAATTQGNNQPVSVGSCGDFPVAARYTAVPGAFTLDPSFNGSGTATTNPTKGEFFGATVDTAGRIVAVGVREYDSGPDDYLIVRYLANGLLDPTFHDEENLDGRVSEPIGEHSDAANAAAIQPDGKIVVAGQGGTNTSSAQLAQVARFNTNGSIDTSFGVNGKIVFNFGNTDAPLTGVAVQPNGKIVLVGTRYDPVTNKNASLIMRLLSNGSFDESFAPGGLTLGIPNTSESRSTGVGLLPDGKILVGQIFTIAGQKVPAVVRLVGGEVPTPVALSAKIKTPSKSKYKAKKLKTFSGTAEGDGLARVQISLHKKDSKLLKKKRLCFQLSSSKAKFKKYKAVKKKCAPRKWLNAVGTTSWRYKLKRALKPGKYTLYVRSLNGGGTPQATPTKKSFTLTK